MSKRELKLYYIDQGEDLELEVINTEISINDIHFSRH